MVERSCKRRRADPAPQLSVSPSAGDADRDQELLETEDPALVYLAELIAAGKNIVFLTGAGISKASGVATYRGAHSRILADRFCCAPDRGCCHRTTLTRTVPLRRRGGLRMGEYATRVGHAG